jgi:hypothetical protein
MIKTAKLKLTRETLVMLSGQELRCVQGGAPRNSAAPAKCEPSGIIPCPTQVPNCA